MAKAARSDPVVKPYRNVLNIADGKVFCVMEAPTKEALDAWFAKMQMSCDYIASVELEGKRRAHLLRPAVPLPLEVPVLVLRSGLTD